MDQEETVCPKCRNSDRVTKASALFGAPSGPALKEFSRFLIALAVFLLFGGAIWGIGMFVGLALFMLRALSDDPTMIPGAVLMLCLLMIAPILFVIIGLLIFRAKPKHEKEEHARVAREKLLWEAAVQKWERLYYCERDDIVFDPKTDKTCRREDITPFVYQPD